MKQEKSEIRDDMQIDWDVPIPMDDGVILRADVFRPIGDGRYPVILSYGPYGKSFAFQESRKGAWDRLVELHPEIAANSSNQYQVFELVDPERWVPDGYACLRIDSRGAGRSPGFLDVWSARETKDVYDCVEWAAEHPWSNGKVGMNGISYFAMNAYYVASIQPPHLAAICAWEGAADYYRDLTHHGGIMCEFLFRWFNGTVLKVQHGQGERGPRSRVTGELVAGPETLPEDVLAKIRVDLEKWLLDHPLDSQEYRDRSPVWEMVRVPMLSSANWGGQGIHPRGNFEAFTCAASREKWLEVHGGAHWESFYTDYGVALQKKFFGHYLKGENTGWDKQPPVQLQVRHVDKFIERHENEWPLARTQWTKFYLHPTDCSLTREESRKHAKIEYEAMGDGVNFLTPPLKEEIEITGPVAAKLYVSSSTTDADIFLVLRVFKPDGQEVLFQGANDPHTPIGLGWLRASYRKLDPKFTMPYQPYHTHDEPWPLKPGEPVELDVEIWPTCIVVPPGYRIGLQVRGKDYHYGGPTLRLPGVRYEMTGVGQCLHNHPEDRPAEIFGGKYTLHFKAGQQPYLLLPIIPPKK